MGGAQSSRPFNFSPGPGCLPLDCLLTARDDIVDWKGTGMSVLETPHRSQAWGEHMDEARERLRTILNLPSSHTILFVSGGACLQFSAIPFNFIGEGTKVTYLVTGHWSTLAYEEFQRLNFSGVELHLVAPLPKSVATDIPPRDTWDVSEDAAYFYFCSNETIEGVQIKEFHKIPTDRLHGHKSPAYPISFANVVFKWIYDHGGVLEIEKNNQQKKKL
jgi:phosphoserine aminotransferase